MFELENEVKVQNLNALSEQSKINDAAVRPWRDYGSGADHEGEKHVSGNRGLFVWSSYAES